MIRIGSDENNNNFAGMFFDDFSIWDVALTNEEITYNMINNIIKMRCRARLATAQI